MTTKDILDCFGLKVFKPNRVLANDQEILDMIKFCIGASGVFKDFDKLTEHECHECKHFLQRTTYYANRHEEICHCSLRYQRGSDDNEIIGEHDKACDRFESEDDDEW